jgi:hypothetical protein
LAWRAPPFAYTRARPQLLFAGFQAVLIPVERTTGETFSTLSLIIRFWANKRLRATRVRLDRGFVSAVARFTEKLDVSERVAATHG